MKRLFIYVVVVAFGGVVSAQETAPPKVQPEPILTPPTGGLTADEYVLALSKAAGKNIIMDATDVPADVRVKAFPATVGNDYPPELHFKPLPIYGWLLEDFRREAGVTVEEDINPAKTTLLRPSPDSALFKRTIVSSGALKEESAPVDVSQLHRDLVTYAQKVHGWAEDAPKQEFAVKMSDLPDELRARVLMLARQQLLVGSDDWTSWLSGDFLQKVVVRPGPFNSTRINPKSSPTVEVAATSSPAGKMQFYSSLSSSFALEPSYLTDADLAQISKQLHRR